MLKKSMAIKKFFWIVFASVLCAIEMASAENASDVRAMNISKLTPLQREVTQNGATERPFENEFWDNKAEGIYVDIVSGEPLFDSLHKYDSGTGWPSFFLTLAPKNITQKEDRSWFGVSRVEVRSAQGNSHLGHVFSDGPKPTGLRYCINSAALRFVPRAELAAQGYGEFETLFQQQYGH